MIIAVPVAERGWFTPVGPVPAPPPYEAQVVWWHWSCTSCGRLSKPRALFSHAISALEMGEYHERDNQCQDGQLQLFTL